MLGEGMWVRIISSTFWKFSVYNFCYSPTTPHYLMTLIGGLLGVNARDQSPESMACEILQLRSVNRYLPEIFNHTKCIPKMSTMIFWKTRKRNVVTTK